MKSNEEILQKDVGMIASKLQDEEKRVQKISNDLKQLENEVNNVEIRFNQITNDMIVKMLMFFSSEIRIVILNTQMFGIVDDTFSFIH